MFRNIVVRLVLYYVCAFFALFTFFTLFPGVLYVFQRERARIVAGGGGFEEFSAALPDEADSLRRRMQRALGQNVVGRDDPRLDDPRLADPSPGIPIAISLIVAFALTLPVTWVYRWTQPGKKYSKSFVQSLLMLPICIALVVFLVKNSLTLAFCLAGIVAAVRFRSSLSQPMDAPYLLVAIGIGLATGTQLTLAAYLGSILFVAAALGVWKSDFGARPVAVSGWRILPPERPGLGSGEGGPGAGSPADREPGFGGDGRGNSEREG